MIALKERFEPVSKRELHLAELQTRTKQRTEGWPEFAEDIRLLVDKAYPDLQDAAKEQLALTHFLGQLSNPQVAFSVKQSRPKNLDEAVTATLEMESYLVPCTSGGKGVAQVDVRELPADTPTEDLAIAATGSGPNQSGELLRTMTKLLQRVENLEMRLVSMNESEDHQQQHHVPRTTSSTSFRGSQRKPVICRRCRQERNFYGCASSRRKQGN